MNDFPWLSVLIALPALGALGVALLPRGRDALAKQVALGVSVLVAALAFVMAAGFEVGGPRHQFEEVYEWIPAFGVHWALGVDGVALVLILMSVVLVPLVIVASWGEADRYGGVVAEGERPPAKSVKTYFALILALEAMMVGVFAATDVFLFYIFFEVMLVPVYFLIGIFGGPQRSYAAVKFLLYSLLGGLLMLVAVIALYVQGPNTFLMSELQGLKLDPAVAKWLFLGFFIAFAIKAPMVPVHTWLPDTAAQAPAGALVLIVGVLDKVGTYGMLRFCLELFPEASKWAAPGVLTFAVISVIYGAVLAIGQVDLKRLIAYTSISHFGFIVLGIFAMTSQGQSGAALYMVNHGFSTGALFLIVGFLIVRRGSARVDAFGGVQKVAPLLAGAFLIAGLSGLSLPGLAPFVSEFLVLVGTFSRYQVAAVIAALGIVLAAVYILWMYQRTMNGPTAEAVAGFKDLSRRELTAIAPILAIIVALGFFPKPVLDVIDPSVQQTLRQVQVSDPTPTVAEKGARP
ncbi:NADH-quinone oxidoreductase subunit M [Thermomonospora curvata]|uniref:Proton-translocating NADH-quinone oxidoreductase, chain M n=1 Tax=Thermomonospora curvata (strain ATCC 19995 / DSM 43183 / JCM 3096 / KCTC 9072 / NBRC 15933 / NCIMB 10081 / Henssen B9) TaxID=471852 RepID=D1A459_THECD|nr:NADH-quinone oxidoreductase subunit M [Thermomonospora curvata]ACY99933.1 proton-translocating NADH-quinone oxidoreductase, chain M [Thermomonospora curvata DSM 43183]